MLGLRLRVQFSSNLKKKDLEQIRLNKFDGENTKTLITCQENISSSKYPLRTINSIVPLQKYQEILVSKWNDVQNLISNFSNDLKTEFSASEAEGIHLPHRPQTETCR